MKTTVPGPLPMFPFFKDIKKTEHYWQEDSVLGKKVSNVKQIFFKSQAIPIFMDLTGNDQGEKAERDQKFSQHGCCLLLACS
jgi:hypothetical protein